MHRVDALRHAHAVLQLQGTQALVEHRELGLGEHETSPRMDGGHQLVLVMGRLVALELEQRLAHVLEAGLVCAGADVHTVDRDFRAGGHALDALLLTIHGSLDAIVIAFAQQIDAVVTGTAPDGVLGLRVNPHRFLGEVEAGLADVAEHAYCGTGTTFDLGVADLVGTLGEHHGGEQHAQHDGKNHEQDPAEHMPLEYDAQYDEHDNRCHEHATAQPRKRLILSLGVFEDLDDLADGALLLLLLFLCFICHRLPRLTVRLHTLGR